MIPELYNIFGKYDKRSNVSKGAYHWHFYEPKEIRTVKNLVDLLLQHEDMCSFSVSPTKCEWYNGNCYTRLDSNYNVLSNIINRNDIEKFYDMPVYSVIVNDEWGYIKVDLRITQ